MCERHLKRRGAAAFRKYGLVSVCGKWRGKPHSGRLSPGAIFGVSFMMRTDYWGAKFGGSTGWRECLSAATCKCRDEHHQQVWDRKHCNVMNLPHDAICSG
jgi:hypothetical protein